MEKSCKYCYQSHKEGYICKNKPSKVENKNTKASKFRNTLKWQKKREEIKTRDNYLCQICIRNLYNTYRQYNYENLQVHHNVPINGNYELNLDSNNLLTVCTFHHKLCESGEIDFNEVRKIIQEQND
ncbi:MAG: hypothetical protein Pg6B_04490 [Candidatus Azobacteroides pseudotrichonymphae]|uniref:HNH endonuclease n=1 Tax=Candidatus Improbicoccus pseudotrichonymphae TaxID=3033792 RepID=A0AA48I0U5_9FIRM|nr:MAG: HNH endonuclease [Candidatus Improbicoccus pseudotrichonymphae]GMO34084.1 MAG: hypothetical protein Pg6B_04490 [Candidatus Azobacteroides pseudotrichonymphae]